MKPAYRRPFGPASFVWMGSEDITLPPLWLAALRLAVRIALLLAAAYAVHLVLDWTTAHAKTIGSDRLMIGVLATFLLAYAILIAVPFMPGIEIGISLLVMEGASIAPLVYGATVLGLFLSFLAGRFIPYAWLHGTLVDLRLTRAAALVARLEPLDGEARLRFLTQKAPKWLVPLIGPWRYLLLAALVNLPGNALIGGGGGIAMTAGFTRLFHPGWAALTFALAVAPVPVLVWIWGTRVLV